MVHFDQVENAFKGLQTPSICLPADLRGTGYVQVSELPDDEDEVWWEACPICGSRSRFRLQLSLQCIRISLHCELIGIQKAGQVCFMIARQEVEVDEVVDKRVSFAV